MKNIKGDSQGMADLDKLIEDITLDAYGDDEKFSAFLQAFEDSIFVPCDGFVIAEPVLIVTFDYDGNERRGLTARCRREDGSEHVVAAADVELPPDSSVARYLAAYRKWLGLQPSSAKFATPYIRKRQHKVTTTDLDMGGTVELVALSVKENAVRCRLLKSDRVITLRSNRLWDLAPGEILVVKPGKQWSYASHPYLSGEIESTRLDVAALGLVPLKLEDQGAWSPDEHYWGEQEEPIEEWATPIIARGPRQAFEMEQVMPGRDPDDLESDPICESNDLKDAGEHKAARKILMDLCQADLRCLDAHAHLGNFDFDDGPKDAIRHYEVGVRIGELSLGPDFDGLLPWGHIDNRPFLRCMHGFGLCLWRIGRFEEAERIFERMLWLNPSDNQGVRVLLDEVRSKTTWKDE
jgi:tetratricopeptide (TPR) repeat protein